MTTSSNIAQELLRSSTEKGNTTMTDEYNITDEEINTTIAKMEDQFIKLEKFLDDEKPENKLKDINKQLKQLNLEKSYLEEKIAIKSKKRHQQFTNFFKELATFAKTINGLSLEYSTDLDNMPAINITYTKHDIELFTTIYFYQYYFPKRTLTDVKEELTTAIAIADQLDGKVNYKEIRNTKHILNPIELTDEDITISFDKQANNRIIVKAEKTTHTYKDGFITTLDDTTTLKTYGFDDDVSQTICDTRTITNFDQLYPLLKDMTRNISDWQTKTTIV